MKSFARIAAALAVCASVAFAFAAAQDPGQQDGPPKDAPPKDAPSKDAVIVPFFGNETCPITGKKVNASKFVESEGQRAYYCCNNCLTKAKADPKAAVAAAYKEPKAVANETCPISGEPIAKDKATLVTWQGRMVALCCKDCEEGFAKSPFLNTCKAVYKAEDLGNATCPVMDEESNDEDVVIYKGKIVRLCCPDCSEEFKAKPDEMFQKAGGK